MSFEFRSAIVISVIALTLFISMRATVNDRGLGWLRAQIGLALCTEIVGFILAKKFGANAILYNAYLIVEFILLCGCAWAWRGTTIINLIAALCAVVMCSVAELVFSGSNSLTLIGSSLASLLLTALFLLVLWHISEQTVTDAWSSPKMLISMAHVLFFASATTLVAPISLLADHDRATASVLYLLLQVVLVLRYMLISIVLWRHGKKTSWA